MSFVRASSRNTFKIVWRSGRALSAILAIVHPAKTSLALFPVFGSVTIQRGLPGFQHDQDLGKWNRFTWPSVLMKLAVMELAIVVISAVFQEQWLLYVLSDENDANLLPKLLRSFQQTLSHCHQQLLGKPGVSEQHGQAVHSARSPSSNRICWLYAV